MRHRPGTATTSSSAGFDRCDQQQLCVRWFQCRSGVSRNSMTDVVILYALPVFLLLIAGEWSYGVVKGKSTYRINDCISSLSQGLLSQAVAVCTQLFQIGLYTIIFKRLAVVHAAAFWQTAVGWILAVILFDFFDYWLHRASHEIAVLWAAHVVHHQSEHFNF